MTNPNKKKIKKVLTRFKNCSIIIMKIKNKGGYSTKYGGISMVNTVNMDNELVKKILYTFQGTVGTYEEQVILNDILEIILVLLMMRK